MWVLGSSGESVSGVMEGEDSQAEVFFVAVAVRPVLKQLDFVVDAFQWAGGDRVVVPGQQARHGEFSASLPSCAGHGRPTFGLAAPLVETAFGSFAA